MNALIPRWSLLPFVATAVALSICGQNPPSPSPADAVPGNSVVVKVDGKDITADEVRAAIMNMPPEFTTLYARNPTYAVQQMFLMRHLAEEAEKAKLDQQSPLKDQLAMLRANVLASAMVSSQHNGYQPTHEAAENYYNLHKEKYRVAKVKGIALNSGAGAGPAPSSLEEIAKAAAEGKPNPAQRAPRSLEDTKKLASDLVQQIRQGGDFAKLAAQYSDDPQSKAANGDFPPVDSASSYPENIKQAIFALKPGDITEPLTVSSKIYIFRLEEISYPPFEQVSVPVYEELRKQHVDEWMQGLAKRFAPVVQNPQFFGQPKTGVIGAPGSPVISGPGAPPPPSAK
jgi:peptidyl-prolyl cis-trans isomerase C